MLALIFSLVVAVVIYGGDGRARNRLMDVPSSAKPQRKPNRKFTAKARRTEGRKNFDF